MEGVSVFISSVNRASLAVVGELEVRITFIKLWIRVANRQELNEIGSFVPIVFTVCCSVLFIVFSFSWSSEMSFLTLFALKER